MLNPKEEQYNILAHEGLGYTEVRCIKAGKVISLWFEDKESYLKYDFSKYERNGYDIYIGINPRADKKGTDVNINFVNCLVIDIDPTRPKGSPSSIEQNSQSIRIAEQICSSFDARGYVINSGSGAHYYLLIDPIKVTNPEAIKASIKKEFLDPIKAKFETADYKIDHIFDLSRVIRVWGTENQKSKRLCEVLKRDEIRVPKMFSQSAVMPILTGVSGVATVIPALPLSLPRFNHILKTDVVVKSIMDGTAKFESRSEADFALISKLTKAHFTKEEITQIARSSPLGRKEELRDDDIKRIIEKVSSNGIGVVSPIHNVSRYISSLNTRSFGSLSGVTDLDNLLCGFKGGRLYTFAARPSVGKTSLLTQIGSSFAKIQGKQVLAFTTEVGYEPIFDKIVAQNLKIDLSKFNNGSFTVTELENIQKFSSEFSKIPFMVCEDFALTLETIEKKVKEIAPEILIVDYIQAMKYKEGGSHPEITIVMRGLHEIATKYNIPVLIASQINRIAEGQEVNMSHLKGSGSIEELSDVIIAMWPVDKSIVPMPVDLHVLKSKYGNTDRITLMFDKRTGRFESR